MYNIVIVDDEARQCRGLKNIFLKKFPESTAEAFTEAKQALPYIEQQQIKLIITDICMPDIDGLELTEKIRGIVPEAKIILLTGYAEFEYARKALALGAFDYLLKPLNPDKLWEVLDKAVEEIRQEELLCNQQQWMQKQLDITLPVYLEKLMNQWVYGWVSEEEKKEVEAIIPSGDSGFMIATKLIGLNNWQSILDKEELSDKKNQIAWWLREQLGRPFHSLSFYSNILPETMITVVTYSPKEQDYPQMIKKTGFDLTFPFRSIEKGDGGLRAIFGVGIKSENFTSNVENCYKSAIAVLPYHFYFPKDCVLKASYILNRCISTISVSLVEEELIKGAIREGREGVVRGKEALEAIFMRCLSQGYPEPKKLKNALENLIRNAALSIRSDVTFQGDEGMDYDDTAEDFLNRAGEYLERLAAQREEQISYKNEGFAEALEEYMNACYKEDISLDHIAEHFGLTPAYFSALVKETTGTGFSKGLVYRRIKLAKELLSSTNKKIYEIAEEAGYSDVKYFNRVFKKETGVTPIEYRDGLKGLVD